MTSSIALNHRPRSLFSNRRRIKPIYILTFLTICVSLFLYLYSRHHPPTPSNDLTFHLAAWSATRSQSSLRIAKATILYSQSNNIYNRSLTLHELHNDAFEYEMHVLRTPIMRGYANTLLWLQHLIVQEMMKRDEEKVEWILFFTPTVLVSNPQIPLHTFLPPLPSSDFETFKALCFIGIKSNDIDMNSSLFFVRVSALSLRILNLAMAAVYTELDRDWGDDIVSSTLQYVLEKEEYRDKVIWQPKEWYNGTDAVFQQPWGKSGVERLLGMDNILEGQSLNSKARETYPGAEEVKKLWDTVMEAKRVLSEAKDRGHTSEEGEFVEDIRVLKDWVELRTWDASGIRQRLGHLKEQLEIGEIIGYEIAIG